ncbi:hypothetical protein BOX15_Mlig029954g2, partial [Macrostomum lignano]
HRLWCTGLVRHLWRRRRRQAAIVAAAVTALLALLLLASASLSRPLPPSFQLESASTIESVDLFDSRRDVIVLLHMQKTGGSHLNRQLVSGLRRPDMRCQCGRGGLGGARRRKWRCSCRNSRGDLWLVSRYSTGWLCGLHADFAALSACVPGQLAALDSDFERPRRLRYVTMLRRPADRFLSEWQHARRGATWRKSQPTCRGRRPPPCRTGDGAWRGVSLAEFAACRANPALNRQARMLANASGLPCQAVFANGNRTADLLLASALHNLVGMAAFGLTEWQILTQYLLSRRLGLSFSRLFWQQDATVASNWRASGNFSLVADAGDLQQRRLAELANPADARLYAAAERLFFGQARRLLAREPLLSAGQRARVRDADSSIGGDALTALARRVLLELGAVEVDDAEKADIRRRVRKKLLRAGNDEAESDSNS